MLMTLIEVILCVIVHLFDLPADANAGMDECVLGVSWHVSDSAIDGGYGVNGRWPSGFGLIHKTQLGVRVGSLNPFAEKHIFAVNVKGIGMVGLRDVVVKILPKLRGNNFIGINSEHPLVGHGVYRKIACWLRYGIVFLRESDDFTLVLTGNVKSIVGTFHVAY